VEAARRTVCYSIQVRSTLSERQVEKLRQFDTPTICNAIELFAVRPRNEGYMDARVRACFPEIAPMVGYAATATFRAALGQTEATGYATLVEQVRSLEELPGPAVVVFQDLDDPAAAATFGEVMCATYQRFGAAGLITSGAGRDLAQVRRLQFPVFTSGAICSHGYCHFPSLMTPVRVGGLAVRPGDLLHGDANGVTSIPLEIADEVSDVAAEFIAAEGIVLEFLKTGPKDAGRYTEARQQMQRRLELLAQRVRKR
jgi:regulator of RNase E activity RraA